jgi:hypothetical protein
LRMAPQSYGKLSAHWETAVFHDDECGMGAIGENLWEVDGLGRRHKRKSLLHHARRTRGLRLHGRSRGCQEIPHADSGEKIARMARVRFQLAPQAIDDDREEVTLSYVLLAPDRLQQDLLSHNPPGMLRKDGEKVILDWCEDDLPFRQGHQVLGIIHRQLPGCRLGRHVICLFAP